MWSPKKKKIITPMEAFFSPILRCSPKKKKKKGPSSEFCNFSLQFLRHTRARRREPRLFKVFGGKQKRRFLAGEKTPEFAKFQCENARKNFALFALFCAYREHCTWVDEILELVLILFRDCLLEHIWFSTTVMYHFAHIPALPLGQCFIRIWIHT